MLYVRMKCLLTGECSDTASEWPGNVVVSKHVSMHASFEMESYEEKLQYFKNINIGQETTNINLSYRANSISISVA